MHRLFQEGEKPNVAPNSLFELAARREMVERMAPGNEPCGMLLYGHGRIRCSRNVNTPHYSYSHLDMERMEVMREADKDQGTPSSLIASVVRSWFIAGEWPSRGGCSFSLQGFVGGEYIV
jgi:hypothetical protein